MLCIFLMAALWGVLASEAYRCRLPQNPYVAILGTEIKKSKQVCLLFSVQLLRFTALYRILKLLHHHQW